MGYGPIVNGKQTPITPWKGSWAQQEEERRRTGAPIQNGAPPSMWPLGHGPYSVRFPDPAKGRR